MEAGGAAIVRGVPQYVGNIYPFSGDVVRGWLADKRNLEGHVTFGFYVDSELKGQFVANRSRKHLRDQNLGTGDYGFDVPIDPSWSVRTGALIAVRPLGAEFFELVQRVGGEAPKAPAVKVAEPINRESVLKFLRATDDETLAGLLREARNGEVLARARGHFASKNWKSLVSFHRVLIGVSKEYERLLMLVGRGALYTNDYNTAMRILAVGAALFPATEEMHFYCGVAHTRAGRHADSIPHFRAALRLLPTASRTHKELANALRRVARDAATPRERLDMISEAASLMKMAVDHDPSRSGVVTLARLYYDLGRNEEAVQLADQLLAEKPDEIPIMLLKSRNLVAMNRVGEALKIAQAVLKLDPLDQTARFQVRALRYLDDEDADHRPPTYGELSIRAEGLSIGPLGSPVRKFSAADESANVVAARLSETAFDWLRIAPPRSPKATEAQLAELIDPFAGFVSVKQPGANFKLWRKDSLVQLIESGLLSPSLSNLAQFEPLYGRDRPDPPERPTAVVLSRHGSFKFGGGEHFIASMAEHYRSVGFDPIIVGVRPELVGKSGVEDGVRFAFVQDSPAALRRLFIENNARLVHVISGLGFSVTDALSHTNIPFIYGVHFWREALGDDSDEGYFDQDGAPVPRAEFRYILSRAASVYANSQYTRSILETAFGVRCPVIYSVPQSLETSHEA